MTKPRAFAVSAIFVLMLIAVIFLSKKNPPTPRIPAPDLPTVEASPPEATIPETPPPQMQRPKSSPALPSAKRDLGNPLAPASIPPESAPRPAESNPEAAADLDQIVLMFRDYRTIAGENPVGTNAEIMKAITGGNPKGAKLGPPEGMALDGEGQLLDRWGTPYFFHQLSKDLMEIHSAGPDQKMGTDDDLMIK